MNGDAGIRKKFAQAKFNSCLGFVECQAPNVNSRQEVIIEATIRPDRGERTARGVSQNLNLQFIAGPEGEKIRGRLTPFGANLVGRFDRGEIG